MSVVQIFLLGIIIGGAFEMLFAFIHAKLRKRPFRINNRLTITKELSIIALPIWGIIALAVAEKSAYVPLFIYSAIIGTTLEYTVGKAFHALWGVKIFVYKHGALGDYTSIYSIPYWGGAGVVFAVVAKLVGIL